MTKYGAEFYESNHELDQWEELDEVAVPVSKKLSTILSIRFTDEEVRGIRETAARLQITMSQFVREAAIRSASSGFRFSTSNTASNGTTSNTASFQSTTGFLNPSVNVVFEAA